MALRTVATLNLELSEDLIAQARAHHDALVAPNDEAQALLEGLVDRRHCGFSHVVSWLADIAHAKAEHTREAWEDKIAAARYEALAMKLEDFVKTIELI